ncbi:MAG: bile acid:sodium symporter family protein [Cytophagaceae bacterium]|nr:bile acid:sodium symporter family protein [Cytophagaceae bacterium]MBK9509061.1 bile acid:sodium symporter family protein [Cytophagaceae bacterium]MBK9934072.1 bile acid:sodium symporter family protein [Cytophagaceae bacterium]MBL0300530.1 bile acid:sodium symporter family protein [Cytophagaceae bacterium]MBL0327464.1 bile acid:sodium symporter family protein [Cytophagaceae bacterium]
MKIKDYWYTISIIFLVILGYNFPDTFSSFLGIKLNTFIKPVLQIIMLGMGATMTVQDFVEIFKSPKKVFIGLLAQFTIMPILGFLLSRSFDFPPEVAAGVVLIGCSPSGLASNVMALMAKANVALSITITSMATLMAPVMTPLLMKILGGELIEINFLNMFWDMSQLVLIPIILGLLLNKLFPEFVKRIIKVLPVFSMLGIAYIILVVTASGAASLRTVGLVLILVVFIHNTFGYLLGYFSAKLFRLAEIDARAIAIEVGMQNGGLASALANEMGKIATVGLAPAIFGPLMNVTGSMIANYWSKNEPKVES